MIMGFYGFEVEQNNIIPDIKQTKNEYGITRHIIRFVYTGNAIKVLEEEIKNG